MHTKIQTRPIRVLVTTDDYEIEGYMHIKPGGYQSRISDLLNMRDVHYLPITQVRFRNLHRPDEPLREVETMIVRLDTIKVVVPLDSESAPGAQPDQSASAGTPVSSARPVV